MSANSDKNIKGRLCEAHSIAESTQLAYLSCHHAKTAKTTSLGG